MVVPETRRVTPYHVRMLAMADRLFAEFDNLPARSVFSAIATAGATISEQHRSPLPDPDHVEQLAREQLSSRHSPDAP